MAEAPLPGLGREDSQRPLLRIRANSISNERGMRGSPSYASLISPAPAASPDPVFIAASAASQIVTNHHDLHADNWSDPLGMEPSGETALVASGALKLVNGFLDQLLFSIITASRSTSLAALRPAVTEVLKPKLAKEVIAGADQELHDYLGTGDDAELLAFHSALERSAGWDPEKVWKRTRLRCMVYSSLGDMEEEDEDLYVQQQELSQQKSNRYSISPFVVSPAVAIFLTSILEFMGEQALVYAGEHAYHRLCTKREKELNEGGGPNSPYEILDRVIVEECDMEKVALDRTLGRLWRGWRKRLRSPSSRSMSRDSYRSRQHSRSISSSARMPLDREARRPSIQEVINQEFAASVPLPMTENDVREIEIPDLASSDDEDTCSKEKKRRPKSMMMLSRNWEELLTPDESQPQTPITPFVVPPLVASRKRSNSVPTPVPSPYAMLFPRQDEVGIGSALATEEAVLDDAKEQEVVGRHDGQASISARHHHREFEQSSASFNGDDVCGGASNGNSDIKSVTGDDHNSTIPKLAGDISESRPMSSDSDTAEQYYVENPKIMTSHRISVGGLTPDSPISPSLSSRSISVQSVKLIDVPSRSPVRKNQGSTEGTSPLSRSPVGSFARDRAGLSTRSDRNSGESIVDVAEPESKPHEPMQGAVQASQALPTPRFVLAPAPTTQKRVANALPVPEIPTRTNFYDLKPHDTGVPPLTPLREMMEGAADTSDEASSISASNDSRSVSLYEDRVNGHTPNASIGQSRSEENRRPVPIPEKSSHRTRKESLGLPKHSSEVVNRSHRSASQSSLTSPSNKVVKVMRTSSDYGDDNKGKSFEELIRSDQTIQYTLTPQNMREIESPDLPRVENPPKLPTETPNGPPLLRSNTTKSASTVHKFTSLHSNPLPEALKTNPFKPVPRPATSNASRARSGAPQARDARIERESIGDFADFIRSTGPTGLSRLPPRSSPAGVTAPPRSFTADGTAPPRSPPNPPLTRYASAAAARTANTAPMRRSESSAGRARLMAREAVVPHSDNNSDLIDFIRQGPPSENTRENPRIPRHVAPFRTTMDSDQMISAVGGRAFEQVLPISRNSETSTNISETMHSSVNSQSASLNGTNRKTVARAQSHSDFDMMPKRKTRRVKDPYAIDFSDEEDDELFALSSKKPKRQEESLIDFLNNVPPPLSMIRPPENDAKPKTLIKKKPSKGIMARFSRSNSISTAGDDPSPRTSTASRPATIAPQLPTLTPTLLRAPTSGSDAPKIRAPTRSYTDGAAFQKVSSQYQFKRPETSSPKTLPPKFQSEKPISYQPARGNYVSQLDTERKPPSTADTAGHHRAAQRTYQPREARHKPEGTNDLASFLMASHPPPAAVRDTPPEPYVLSDGALGNSGGSFSRMFRKKKAVGGYA